MAEWDEYGSTDEGWKKYMEGIIPLIILILIGIVIAGRMGWIQGIPFLGDLFDRGPVRVAVLGDLRGEGVQNSTHVDAPYLASHFDESADYQVTEFSNLEMFEYTGEELLNEFDLVILAGERSFSPRVKEELGKYIKGGGEVIAIGDAAIHDPDYPAVIGWDVGDLQGTFPIGVGWDVSREEIDEPVELISTEEEELTLRFMTIDHDIVERAGVGTYVDFREIEGVREECATGITSLPIGLREGSDVISIVEGYNPEKNQSKTVIGMAERKGALGRGHVMYYPYDPGCLPTVFDETVEYMTGRSVG